MIRGLLLLVAVASCTETVRLGDDRLAGLTAIAITPEESTVEITDLAAEPEAVRLVAIGTFGDGSRRDITALLEWTVDDPLPGALVAPGAYLASRAAGGHVAIEARVGDIAATARLHVIVSLSVVDGVFPPPSGAESLFADGTPVVIGGVHAPRVVYPSTGTLFPQDLARILFQLAPGSATDAYRWRLDSDVVHVHVLSGSDRWQPDGAIWALLSASHRGADVQLVAEAAMTSAPGTIHSSAPAMLSFAAAAADGILYHWTAGTNAVMRGTPASESASRFYPEAGDATCAGCHAVSRDGRQMALGYDGENLRTLELDGGTPVITTPLRPMGWATFSPTGDLLVVADHGVVTLRDATSGAPVGPDGGRVPLPTKASHPDWSPDGGYVVVTLTPDVSNLEIRSGAIARVAYRPTGWGPTEILVPGSGTSNNYFPKYSPDGRFIAYVRARTASRGADSAELRLMHADGSGDLALRVANHRVAGVDDVPDLANSMPTWAPVTGDLGWLAFTSKRPYGVLLPAAGLGQIWVTGLDLRRFSAGLDPSFAAFWLPAQDVRVLNNNPIWAPFFRTTN